MKTTKTYQGRIELRDCGSGGNSALFLSSLDQPLSEDLEWMRGKRVTVRFWITDMERTRSEAAAGAMMGAPGYAYVELRTYHSDHPWASLVDERLTVCGYALLEELKRCAGNWLILEIEGNE